MLSIRLSLCLLSIYPCVDLSIHLSIHLSILRFIHPTMYHFFNLTIQYLQMYILIYQSNHSSIHLTIHLSIYLSYLIMNVTKDFNEKLEIEENLKIKLNFSFDKSKLLYNFNLTVPQSICEACYASTFI